MLKIRSLTLAGIVAVVLVVLFGVGSCTYETSIKESNHGPCTVTGKDRTSDSKGNSNMRIYTQQCGNFEVSDALLKGKFNSSDTYAELALGHTYDFTTTGFRFGFTSSFPNIISAEEIR